MLKLVIANKNYSSWSLRPWLVLKAFGIPFEEIIIPLRQPDSRARVLEYSPSGKVPALICDGETVWDSMAIIETLADRHPELAIWPRDMKARGHARAIANEMHSGFQTMRQTCPMDLGKRYATPEITAPLQANIDRIETVWSEARERYGSGGPYLYGAFGAADAVYAPIVTRIQSFNLPVKPETRHYMDAILTHPDFVAWRDAAMKETWTIPNYAAGHIVLESFRAAEQST